MRRLTPCLSPIEQAGSSQYPTNSTVPPETQLPAPYVSLLVGGWLAWYTGLDFLPMFVVAPLVGRLLSCAFMGMGPAVLYDLVTLVGDWAKKRAGRTQ